MNYPGLTDEEKVECRAAIAVKVSVGDPLEAEELDFLTSEIESEYREVMSPVDKVKSRSYTMTPAALKQRRENSARIREENLATGPTSAEGKDNSSQNARTHGLYAQQFISSAFFKPCKSTCKNYPCEMIDNGSTKPGERCMSRQHFLDALGAIEQSLLNGKPGDLNELMAVELAGHLSLMREIMDHIGTQGVMLKSTEAGKNGVVNKLKVHPGIKALTDLIKVTGISFPEFLLTPKSEDNAKTSRNLAESLIGKQSTAAEKLASMSIVDHEDEDEDPDGQ